MGNGTPEARALEAKVNTVNGVILSEADYFDQIRIPDFSIMLKQYLQARLQNITNTITVIALPCLSAYNCRPQSQKNNTVHPFYEIFVNIFRIFVNIFRIFMNISGIFMNVLWNCV